MESDIHPTLRLLLCFCLFLLLLRLVLLPVVRLVKREHSDANSVRRVRGERAHGQPDIVGVEHALDRGKLACFLRLALLSPAPLSTSPLSVKSHSSKRTHHGRSAISNCNSTDSYSSTRLKSRKLSRTEVVDAEQG